LFRTNESIIKRWNIESNYSKSHVLRGISTRKTTPSQDVTELLVSNLVGHCCRLCPVMRCCPSSTSRLTTYWKGHPHRTTSTILSPAFARSSANTMSHLFPTTCNLPARFSSTRILNMIATSECFINVSPILFNWYFKVHLRIHL